MRTALPLLIAAALSCTTASAAGLPVCPVQDGTTAQYDILRGGAIIGRQTLRFATSGADLTVGVEMTASLRAMGIRVYHYEHHGEEHWRDGQLLSLRTRTDDDGTPRRVDATRDSGGWHGTTGAAPGAAPLLPSSLWDSGTVAQTRLLDRETGEIVAVRVTPAAEETLQLGSRTVAAHRYDLAGVVSGSVWYDGKGCWLRALFHTRVDGSLIEVRAQG